MAWSPRSELIDAASAAGVAFHELTGEDARKFKARVSSVFARECGYWQLWEYAADGVAVYSERPWEVLGALKAGGEVLLFFNPGDGADVFGFASLGEVAKVLEGAARFEFAVADALCGFLLVYNHSGFLVGRGDAADWLSCLVG